MKKIFLDFVDNELDAEFEVDVLQSQISTYQQVISRQKRDLERSKVTNNLRKQMINSFSNYKVVADDKLEKQTVLIQEQKEKLAQLENQLKKRARPVEDDISPETLPRRSKRARVTKE